MLVTILEKSEIDFFGLAFFLVVCLHCDFFDFRIYPQRRGVPRLYLADVACRVSAV